MAPIKHNRDVAARNRDKTKRRRRPAENVNQLLYKCLGDICGEECEQELQPMSQRGSDGNRLQSQRDQREMDLEAAASDADDADYVDEREMRRQPTMKAGRVSKAATKKPSLAKQMKDMPAKLGLQKAEGYLCSALEFGVQAGYLTPKDLKGRVLRVASGLLQTIAGSVKRINSDAMEARALERRAAPGPRSGAQRRPAGQREPQDSLGQEVRDDEAEVPEAKRNRRAGRRARGLARRHGAKRAANSRSRSRSVRRHGRTRSAARSRSSNPEADGRAKRTLGDAADEQEELANDSQETTASSHASRNDDDGKSVKSSKSSKSAPNTSDSRTSAEDKKHNDDNDASNDEEASDDEDDEQKK